MSCVTSNTTMDKAARAALAKDLYGDLNENSSADKRAEKIEKINKELYPKEERYVNVEAKDLPSKLRMKLGIVSDDTIVERYKGFLGRTTDATKALFVKTFGAIQSTAMSLLKDNVTKRDTGTLMHSAIEQMMKQFLSVGNYKNVKKYDGEVMSDAEIARTYGLKPQQINSIKAYVKEELEYISKQQQAIDSTKDAYIFNEMFLPDPIRDTAGTIDVFVLYSDNSADILDYKTVYPYVDGNNKRGKYQNRLIGDDVNVIPGYKITDITLQLRTNKETVLRNGLANSIRRNRAIPINVNLKYDKKAPEGERYIPDINFIAIGEKQDPALQLVPVDEVTGIGSVDKAIDKLRSIEVNYANKLEKADKNEKSKWAYRINAVRRSINNLILNRDLSTMIKESQLLLNRYYDRVAGLKDIENEFIKEEANAAYLSQLELSELISEFEAYRSILSSSREFYAVMGMKNEDVKKALDSSDILLGSISAALVDMRGISHSRAMDSTDIKAIDDVTKLTFWQKMFRTLSQQVHPVMVEFNKKIQTAFNKSRVNSQKFYRVVQDWDKRLDKVEQEMGLTRKQIYKMFINEYGEIHKKYTGLSKKVRDALVKEDKVELNKLLQLKSNAEELRKKYRDRFIIANDPTKEQLKEWDDKHDFNNAIIDSKIQRWYYEYRENSEFYTEGYKQISKNATLLEFWNFWQETMENNRELVGHGEYELIPNNFLPWIRQDVIDMIANGDVNLPGVKEYIKSLYEVKEDDMIVGVQSSASRDPETGAFKKMIPLYFTSPLHNTAGKADPSMKSIDLLKSLYVFTNAVNQYHYLKNDVEPHVEALKDIIVLEGQKIQTSDGRDISDKSGTLAKLTGKEQDWVDLFNKHVDYHLYGIKIQDASASAAKFWMGLKNYQQIKELAFAPFAPIGNFVQIRVGAYFEGLKGYFYKPSQLNEVERMAIGGLGKEQKDLYNAIRYFFMPNSDSVSVQARDLSMTEMQKWVSWDTGFIGFRLGEHNLMDNVMVAMMKNYGFDSNGNIKRLDNLPKGTKSLLDGATIKDGKFFIDGFMDKNGDVDIDKFTKFRGMAINVGREIKGGMTPQDMNAINTSLFGSLFMTFKNWMPGMIDARASRIRYDYALDAIVEGKYTGILTDMGLLDGKADGNKALFEIISHGVLPSAGKLLLDLATFGWLFNHNLKYKVNEDRAKAMFDTFKAQYPNTKAIQEMTFQDFLNYKQGQMRSAAAELSIILALVGLIAYLGGESDDGEKRWKKTMASRTMFRLLNRSKREIAFFFDFEGMTRSVLKSPIPLMGLLEDVIKLNRNTLDELGDVLIGEDVERTGLPRVMFGANRGKDTKPILYESMRFIPGNKAVKAIEIFARDQEAMY